MTNLQSLPENLPIPVDDGSANHLLGKKLPEISLAATTGGLVRLDSLSGIYVLYIYPMTGRPDVPLPNDWDLIPGARGCTPQACSYRDHHSDLKNLGASVFALSAQTTEYQKEMAQRLHLPFPVLSDAELIFASALNLPLFNVEGMNLLKRLTLICRDAKVVGIHYPVFPPDKDIDWVLQTLRSMR